MQLDWQFSLYPAAVECPVVTKKNIQTWKHNFVFTKLQDDLQVKMIKSGKVKVKYDCFVYWFIFCTLNCSNWESK
jgi:hypothetical protein